MLKRMRAKMRESTVKRLESELEVHQFKLGHTLMELDSHLPRKGFSPEEMRPIRLNAAGYLSEMMATTLEKLDRTEEAAVRKADGASYHQQARAEQEALRSRALARATRT